MIIDTLDNISIYKKLSKDVYTGLAFLNNIDHKIKIGIHVINNRVKAIVEQYDTINNNSFEFESHKRVIDIQCPIIGLERVFWSPINDMKIKKSYDDIKDIAIYSDPPSPSRYVDIGNRFFAIMFENDGHSPKHCVNHSELIKKITIKVSIE
ncbi:YhcH/YjgK/YiaL family protein [Candidatus Pelagibacter sp.]|nr:YhcH/YjgK/YiaL family protein [Candidatus Pelagibacter sp.]